MTILTGRIRIYLVVVALIIGLAATAVWATLAGAQTPDSDGEGGEHSRMEATGHSVSSSGPAVPYEGPSGIQVSGTGRASAAPDIAVISLGVEALEDTAAEARAGAAAAMTKVIEVLTDAGVAEEDIQTLYFNISPRYQHLEIERCEPEEEEEEGTETGTEGGQEILTKTTCYNVWENRLVGYSVSNSASVKVRELGDTGSIIDKVADSAGDLVRINGVDFQIEDTQGLDDLARTDAVSELFRKAQMLADLSGVKLGSLVYLDEQASYRPPQPLLYARAEAASADSSTPILGGRLESTVTLQGVFLIEEVADHDADSEPKHAEEPDADTEGPTPESTEASSSNSQS